MGDWNRPRHLVLVLAVSSKIKVMCIFIVFLIQCIPSHLQHNMRGVYVLAKHSSYIYICKTFFYLSKYSLSDAHFSTGRLLFEFNRFQCTLAAPEVFVASANPVSLPSGYRVSIVRNTNIDQIETTPLRYCMRYACCMLEHAYLKVLRQHSAVSGIDLSVYRSTSEA